MSHGGLAAVRSCRVLADFGLHAIGKKNLVIIVVGPITLCTQVPTLIFDIDDRHGKPSSNVGW